MQRRVASAWDGQLSTLRDRRPLYLVAEEALRDLIRRMGLSPGDHLHSERELTRLLGVGRSTVREALRYLHISGFVKTIHGSRTIVTGGGPSEIVAGLETLDSFVSGALRLDLIRTMR